MKSQGFLAKQKMAVAETVDARKHRLGRDDVLTLARAADTIVDARGKSITFFDMKNDPPGDAELLAAMLGPTGNLRAPTVRVGGTLIVGFSAEAYAAMGRR